MNHFTILAPLVLVLSGCATLHATDVVQPKEVTLEQALLSVGCGLKAMDEAQGPFRTGLFPSEIEVKLALSTSASESGKLTLALASPGNAAKVGGESGQESKAERSNTVTIKFVNVLGMQPTTLVGAKSPEELTKILKAIKDSGFTTLVDDHIDIREKWHRCP